MSYNNPGHVPPDALKEISVKARSYKKRIYEIIPRIPGTKLLDVGCGPGLDTEFYKEIVGNKGLAVGLDYDHEMIRRATDQFNQQNIHFTVGDAKSIPFNSGFFDVCIADRLLQHVDEPAHIIRELVRITAPHGQIIAADADWCTLSIDIPDYELERRFVYGLFKVIKNGSSGRQLKKVFVENGIKLEYLEVYPIVWQSYKVFKDTSLSISGIEQKLIETGYFSEKDLHDVKTAMNDKEEEALFFASANVVVASGIKK